MVDFTFHNLVRVTVNPVAKTQRLSLHLTFRSSAHHQDGVQFELSQEQYDKLVERLSEMRGKAAQHEPPPSKSPTLQIVVDNTDSPKDGA